MRLIDVNVLLTGERGTQQDCDIKPVLREFEDTVIDYAILSHRWVPNEVDYTEIITLTKTKNRDEIRGRTGYQKIVNSCKQAKNDGLEWLWVDTCCIDKWNSSELSEALNSMFRWYENSRRCYAYLHDVDVFPTSPDTQKFPGSQGWPEWFSRCWTLPELIAPRELQFFNAVWQPIGDKRALASMLEVITRVPSQVLLGGLASYGPSVAQVMSWAAARRTTRTEDRAYSLLGLLGVNMPMLYGEGKIAFLRLQLEVIRKSNDQTIFAWTPVQETWRTTRITGVLADDPSLFRDCHDIIQINLGKFDPKSPDLWGVKKITGSLLRTAYLSSNFLTLRDWRIDMPAFHTFTITNEGIQAKLPLRRYPGSLPVLQVTLACRREGSSRPITVDMVPWKSRCYRHIGDVGWDHLPRSYQHTQLILAYELNVPPSGIVIEEAHGVAALLLEACAAKTGIEVVGRNVQPVGVTIANIHRVLPSSLGILASAFYVFRYFAFITVLLTICEGLRRRNPSSFFEVPCYVVIPLWILWDAVARIPIIHHCTTEAPPFAEYILSSDREIVLLRGTGRAVTSIIRSETSVAFRTLLRVRSLVLCLQAFLVALLLARSTPTTLPVSCLTITATVWLFTLAQRELLDSPFLMHLLCQPKLTKYMFGTRTSGVVFALLVLQTEKIEEVMNELLSTPNTRAWRKWKTIILDCIKHRVDFDFEASNWDDGTWSDTEKSILIDLFQDTHDALQAFGRYLAESRQTR